jgi:DNA-binding CsgD family transcriptional regulator
MRQRSALKDIAEEFVDSSNRNIAKLMIDWCESLHGVYSIDEGLRRLFIDIGAEAGMLVRINHSNNSTNKFIEVDTRDTDPCIPSLKRSYVKCVLGEYLTKLQESRLWLSSQVEDREGIYNDPSLAEWQESRSFSELVIFVLSTENDKSEFLEMHFREPVSAAHVQLMECLLPTLCRSWENRTGGLFSTALHEKCHPFVYKEDNEPILGYTNPSQLSRAEFRVCMLLSGGLSIEAIISELSISMATVRSHLRNIYSKTDTSSHAELVYRLLSNPIQDPATSALSA